MNAIYDEKHRKIENIENQNVTYDEWDSYVDSYLNLNYENFRENYESESLSED